MIISAELARLYEERDTLRAEREELRKALSDLLLVAEYKDMKSGESVGSLFPKRFEAARAVLAKGKG